MANTPSTSNQLVVPDLPAAKALGKETLHLSLVVPTYNEAENIEELVKRLSDVLDQTIPNNYELIIVDDNSPDRTWEIAQFLTPQYPNLRIMRRQGEKGLATAVIRGWQAARGHILGVIDGDLQHPPEVLPKLLSAIETTGLAIASRHVEEGGVGDWGIKRRAISRIAQLIGLVILPEVIGRVSDPMSGYFLIRRSVVAGKRLNPLGYKILIEVLARGNKCKIAEVGYIFRERQRGKNKVSSKIYAEYVYHLLILRFSIGPVAKFIQFCLVGLTGGLVDMGAFYLLSDPATLSLGLTRSKVAAAELAIINNFVWNDLWTFRDASSQQMTRFQWFKRLIGFNGVCLIGLGMNVMLLNLLVGLFGLNRYLANLIAIVAVAIWNFYLNLRLNWRVTEATAGSLEG